MAAVRFRLDHPKKDEDKPVSILVQLYVNSKMRPELATGEKVCPANWDQENERATSKHLGYKKLNIHLQTISADLLQLWRDNKTLNSKELRERMGHILRGAAYNPTVEKKTLFIALSQFIEAYKSEKSENSVKMYVTLQKRLSEFDSEVSRIDIDTLDFKFYDKFKAFLYGLPNYNYAGYSLHRQSDNSYLVHHDLRGIPVGIFDDKVFKYFINLKTFLVWAEKRGHKPHPAHKSWEIIRRKYEPLSLTMEELEKLESVQLPEHLSVARDYLVLECRTGQRISDLKRFNRQDLDGFKWTHSPKKGNRISNKKVTIYFKGYCAPAYWILEKYNFKMPELSEQRINQSIKEVCRLAGIDKEMYIERWAGSRKVRITGKKYEFISTHIGRKTFITLALQFMPPKLVMALAGIDSYDTLKHYDGATEDVMIEKHLNAMQEESLMRKAK
jgi:integrase